MISRLMKLKQEKGVLLFWLSLTGVILGLTCPWSAVASDEHTARLIEGAKKEGKLMIYGAVNVRELDTIAKKFQAKYPFIKTQYYRTTPEKMLIKILNEARVKTYPADVFELGALQMFVLMKNGLLAKYLSPERQAYDEYFKDPEGYYTAFFYSTNVMAYNTKLVPSVMTPKSYMDLLNPRWKGKLALPSDNTKWFTCMMKMMGEERARDFMMKLAQQKPAMRVGTTLNTMLLAAAEYPVLVNTFGWNVESLKIQGAPVEWVRAEPVITTNVLVSLPAHVEHPHSAKLFIDYLLSREGQELVTSFHWIPTRSGVEPDPPVLTRGLKMFPFDALWGEDYPRYSTEFYKLFGGAGGGA